MADGGMILLQRKDSDNYKSNNFPLKNLPQNYGNEIILSLKM